MTLEKYLDDRETWQNNTIEEIKKKVIYKPKSLKNSRVGEKLVAIYGPPQIGKTTLILCLIGIAPEFQKKVYNDIRAGVPRGNSSTSTAIIYHQIDADLYGVKYGESRIVEKEQTKVIDLINKIAKDSKSEEYLRAIVEYLKKQYSFSDKRTLCLVLDEIQQKNNMVFNEITPIKSFVETNNIEANLNSLINYIKEQCSFDEDKSLCYFLEQFSNATKERIATIIANQESFVEKYDSIEKVLGDYKDNILVQISANNNSLECIKEQLRKNQQAIKNNGDSIAVVIDKSNDGVEKLNFIQESIDSVSQKTDYVTIMLNSVKDNIGPDSEILGLLSSMNSCIGNEEDNSESDWSIKKNFCDINKKIEELLRKIELQDEMIRTFGEKYKCLEKSQNNMLKMIVVGELISVISVITLIMMQIF